MQTQYVIKGFYNLRLKRASLSISWFWYKISCKEGSTFTFTLPCIVIDFFLITNQTH